MKNPQRTVFAETSAVTVGRVAKPMPTMRPRNAKMDALFNRIGANPNFSFEAAAAAVRNAMAKANS